MSTNQTNQEIEEAQKKREKEIKKEIGQEPEAFKNKKVLAQDQPQRELQERYARQKSIQEYNMWAGKFNIEAQKRYEQDVKEYEKQQTEYQKQLKQFEEDFGISYESYLVEQEAIKKEEQAEIKRQAAIKAELAEIEKERDKEIARIEAQRVEDLKYAREAQGLTRLEREELASDATRRYNDRVKTVKEQAAKKYFVREAVLTYPNFVMGGRVREQFEAAGGQISILGLLESEEVRLKQQAEQARKTSAAKAVSEALKAQKAYQTFIQAGTPEMFSPYITKFHPKGYQAETRFSQKFYERVAAIKPLPPEPVPSVYGQPTLTKAGGLKPSPLEKINVRGQTQEEVKADLIKHGIIKEVKVEPTLEQKQQQTVIEFLQQYKSPVQPPETILTGIVIEKTGEEPVPSVRKTISEITKKPELFTMIRQSTYTDPSTGETFSAKTGEGSIKIAKALGFSVVPSYNLPEPEYETTELYIPYMVPTKEEIKTRDLSKLTYSELVDIGVSPQPQTLGEKIKYYASRAERPITTIPDALGLGGEYRQQVYQPSTFDRLILNVEQAVKKEKPIEKGISETWKYIKKDPFGVIAEVPAETGLWITGGKIISLGQKGLLKVSEKVYTAIKPYLKPAVIVTKEGKIYPNIARQKPLTWSQVTMPAKTELKVQVTEKSKLVKEQKGYKPKPMKTIPTFQTAETEGYGKLIEGGFVVRGIATGKAPLRSFGGNIEFRKITEPTRITSMAGKEPIPLPAKRPDIKKLQITSLKTPIPKEKLYRTYKQPIKEPQISQEKALENFVGFTIRIEKTLTSFKPKAKSKLEVQQKEYEPPKRAIELKDVFTSDTALASFRKMQISLGMGTVKTPPKKVGRVEKPIEPDITYKPSSRVSELKDVFTSDTALASFRKMQISLGMGTVKTPPKKVGRVEKPIEPDITYKPSKDIKEIKKKIEQDTKLYGISEKEQYIGKGITTILSKTKQKTIQIQKPKVTRKQPMPRDFSQKEEFRELPKTGKAPITPIYAKKEEKKKKKQQGYIISVMTPIYATTETEYVIAEKAKTIQIQKPSQISKISERITPKVTTRLQPKQVTRIQQREQTKLMPITKTRIPQKSKQVQKFKTTSPTPIRPKVRLTSSFAPRIRPRQKFKMPIPPPSKSPTDLIFPPTTPLPKPKREPKKKKSKGKKVKEFIGNVQLTRIEGLYKRPELIYGKRVRKLERKDLAKEFTRQKKSKVKIF